MFYNRKPTAIQPTKSCLTLSWTELWLVLTRTWATPISSMNWTLIGAYRNLGHIHLIHELNSDWCLQKHRPHPSHAWTELWLVHTRTLVTPISCINWTLIGAYRNVGHTHLQQKPNFVWCIQELRPHPFPVLTELWLVLKNITFPQALTYFPF